MTAEQKAEYDARQAVEAADKRRREEQYLSAAARVGTCCGRGANAAEAGQQEKAWSVNHKSYG
jgi:hypothetical protein